MNQDLVAQLDMKEFDPTKERHFGLVFIKMVDAGCTAKMQIENLQTGEVRRLTSTDDPNKDIDMLQEAICNEFLIAWHSWLAKVYS